MRVFICFVTLFSSVSSFAAKQLKLPSISLGKTIQIHSLIKLPVGQKLNKGAPSHITVFEQVGSGWVQIEKINLNDYFFISEEFEVNKPISLSSENSKLKLLASLFHCEKLKNIFCVIDDFEGISRRDKLSTSKLLKFDLIGTQPLK